jgi:hypothetical protein
MMTGSLIDLYKIAEPEPLSNRAWEVPVAFFVKINCDAPFSEATRSQKE